MATTLFAIIDWDDGFVNDIPVSSIVEPRLALEQYKTGDRVQARLPGFPGRHWGLIAAIDDDRKWLKSKCTGPRPVSPKQKELETGRANDPLSLQPKNTEILNDPKLKALETGRANDPLPLQPKDSELSNDPKPKALETGRANDPLPLQPKDSELSNDPKPKKSLKRKKLFDDDAEAAQAKKSANVKARNTEMARKRTSMETQTNLIYQNDSNTEVCERLDRLEKKVDKVAAFIEVFLECRHCLRKAYKEKSIEGPSSTVTSTRTSLVTTTPKHVDLSEQTLTKSCEKTLAKSCEKTLAKSCEKTLAKSCEKTLAKSCEKTLAKSCENTVASLPRSYKLAELDPLLESCDFDESTDSDAQESNWSFVGSPRFNIKLPRDVLARCESAAKNLDKLALNLIEVLVSREEAQSASLYGNLQHGKKPLDENKRRALRSHVFCIHGKSMTKEEVEKEWMRLKTPINDKLRKMGRGVYKNL